MGPAYTTPKLFTLLCGYLPLLRCSEQLVVSVLWCDVVRCRE